MTVGERIYEALLISQVHGDLEERRNADGAFTFKWPDPRKCEICGAIVRPRWERP